MGMTWDQLCRRTGGRRHYNSWRQTMALLRQRKVINYWRESRDRHGWQAEAAMALGVHRSTITRGVRTLLAMVHKGEPCPLCGRHQ